MSMIEFANAVALTGSDQAAAATPAFYCGLVIRETAAGSALVKVYDNASAATGTLLDIVALTANQVLATVLAVPVRAANGIYIDVVSGAVEGSVRIG